MTTRAIRLTLDLNVLVSDLIARERGIAATAASMIVDAVRDGISPAGPVQLVVSIPMIEAYADVLERRLDYPREAAFAKAEMLGAYALEGPMPIAPLITVGAGFVPFATEEEIRQAAKAFVGRKRPGLFDEIEDDRHVLLTAIGGRADILVTNNLADFLRGPARRVRDDVLVVPLADRSLVVANAAFARYWLSQGVIPDADFIAARRDLFPGS